MAFSSLRASTCGCCGLAVAGSAAMVFFFGACSSAALPSCPPVQPNRATINTKMAPTIAFSPRILILFSNSKGYAAGPGSVLLCLPRDRRPPRPASNAFDGGLASIFCYQFFVVFIRDAGHAGKRCDELLRTQTPAEE